MKCQAKTIIVQFLYSGLGERYNSEGIGVWKYWKDLGTFESYEHALQVLQIKIERWKKDGECIEIYSSLHPSSIEEKLEIKIQLISYAPSDRQKGIYLKVPYFCEFRFFDTINQKVIMRESPWAIGLK
jgi:hypothetical protein